MADTRLDSTLLDALLSVDALGLCLFSELGIVVSKRGSVDAWAPEVGARLDEAPVFVGMFEEIMSPRETGEPFSLSSLTLNGETTKTIDIDVHWLAPLKLFAAVARSATARVADQAVVSQIVRDARLLEERVRAQQEIISEQADMMRLFIRYTPAAVAMLDTDLHVLNASERWRQDFGDPALLPPGVETASPLTWPRVEVALRLAMENGVPTSRVEKSSVRGKLTWHRLAQAPWRRANGSVGGAILFCEDVTDSMRKAENLRARVEDLHRLGAELDKLGRAVSNDLRAPLRQIDFFSRFLLDARHESLDPASQNYLIQIRATAERIDRMMAALQRYLHLSERELMVTRFDLAEAVEAAATELRDALVRAGVALRIRETLSVEADLSLVSGLFRRLIDNAVKYAGEGSTILVDCFDEDESILVRITDDGPGIATHLRRRAFDFFERLNAPARIQGEGMGLAECRKIAELHGGAMTLDPDFDAGLRVLVTLPRGSRMARMAPASRRI